MTTTPPRTLRRVALLALLVVLLGQAGLLVHKVTVDHLADDTCEVCTSHDRVAGTAAVPFVAGFVAAGTLLILVPTHRVHSRRLVRNNHCRAPPIL